MTKQEAKKWILDNCFTKSGNRFMPNVSSEEFWQRSDKSILAYNYIPKSYESNIYNVLAFLQDIEYFSCIHCGSKLDKNKLYCSTSCQSRCVEYNGSPFKNAWSEEARIKREDTNLERYGAKSPYASKEIRDKRDLTNLERYGVNNVFSSPEIREKCELTQIERYGGVGFQSPEILEKTHNTQMEKYGGVGLKSSEILESAHKVKNENNVLCNIEKDDFKNLVINNGAKGVSKLKNCDLSSVYCAIHRLDLNQELLKNNESIFEKSVFEYIKQNTKHDIIFRDKESINPYELDIYIPELKIAFECNGCYFHSSKFKDKNYHLTKTQKCYEKGIKLIHIFEDDWDNKKEIVKTKISHHLGNVNKIYARNTEIKPVNKKDSKNFLIQNHIQGLGRASIYYGLFYNNELVSLMGFRKKQDKIFILDRFCSSQMILGGFSKLLKHFINTDEYIKIESFHDISYNGIIENNNSVYNKFGFVKEKTLSPDYKYYYKGKRVHKFNFRHKHLKNILSKYNPELSERENCLNHRIYQVYDCGKIKFVLNK